MQDVRDFISRNGVVVVRHEWYTRHGLRKYNIPEQDATEPVVDFIAKGDVFAYASVASQRAHAVWVDKVTRQNDGDEYELRVAPDGDGDLLVLRVQLPTEEDQSLTQDWVDERDIKAVGSELEELHGDLSDNRPKPPVFGSAKPYKVVLAHAVLQVDGRLHTMAAIAVGHGEIAAMAYPGSESVADRWNDRFKLARDNGGQPDEILEHWLERVNGITEELSPPFDGKGVDAADAAHRALVEKNERTDMVIAV